MMYKGEYPYIGNIYKLEIVDLQGFKDNVFGAEKLLQLTEKQRSNNQLYGCMIEMDMGNYFGKDENEKHVEVYLLNENNLIIHDTAFLANEDLQYVRGEIIDHPECINDFAKNMYIDNIKSGIKIRHINGIAYIANKTRNAIYVQHPTDEHDIRSFHLTNANHMDQFHDEYKGFLKDDEADLVVFQRGRKRNYSAVIKVVDSDGIQ